MEFTASSLSDDPKFGFRESLFTPWMGPDTLQAHTNYMVELGMLPIYSEYDPILGFREIYWTPVVQTYFEVRSARNHDEFQEIVERNCGGGHMISTLHVSTDRLYTSTWLSSEGLETAERTLDALGISRATIRS